MVSTPDWIVEHQQAWNRKPGLRAYYRTHIFDRVIAQLQPGATLELGAGPGFFADHYHGELITTDISPSPAVAVCADAHQLPFADAEFDNLVGIDVLHHLARPAEIFREAARVLKPGGRIILVEPWTSWFGRIIYRFFHHEDCHALENPWAGTLENDTAPMDGNAEIPKALLRAHADELAQHVPALEILEIKPFAMMAYLATGGFQSWSAPSLLVQGFAHLEDFLPQRIMDCLAVRALIILRRR